MSVVAVVGLGYVGLPLAVMFGKLRKTIGYDPNSIKIENYKRHLDPTGEVSSDDLRQADKLTVTDDPSLLATADYIIIAVPTPIDQAHKPDFGHLTSASQTAGQHMKKGVIVIYESTVYPGATEEICIPILEQHSHLEWKKDFHIGYSPERINPGDKEHTLSNIVKVVSGDDPSTLEKVAKLYESIVTAGVFRTSSIKTAEAAKVIENTQRDLNIALMNELAIIFNKLGLDTLEVLQAAETKWNFLRFRPGLVGGHCIGVDPYYLTYKAQMLGYHPEVILAGRRINDEMGKYIAEQTVKLMIRNGSQIKGSIVNVLGVTFKEDVPDIRNSRVIDLINELRSYGIDVHTHDPVSINQDAQDELGIDLVSWDELPPADALIVAVAHTQFLEKKTSEYLHKIVNHGCFIDVKSKFNVDALKKAGISVMRL